MNVISDITFTGVVQLEWKVFYCRTNVQDGEHLIPHLQATALRKNPYYSTYYNNLARLILLGIIPLTLLAYFNCMIYKGMKLPSFLSQQENVKEKRRMQESELATVLIGIVVVFVSSHILRIFLNVSEMIMVQDVINPCYPTWCQVAQTFNDLFLALNSSSNMIIYCCLNSTFRKHIKQYGKTFLSRLTCTQMSVANTVTYDNINMTPTSPNTYNNW